ncbi:MAG TPA: hypothetical protein VGS19_39050 [Streptosporangiaceae bacterium]|nr:hypothetical protein [Streptosporangiaceae bacterium]
MNKTSQALRVAVVGLAGCGKSTCAGLVEDFARDNRRSYQRVKLAKPLYDLQEAVYGVAGVPLQPGSQDQLLMEALADALRRIRPESIVDDFAWRLGQTSADIVINDDLRDPFVDAPRLRQMGFRVLRVTCQEDIRQQRLAERGDLTRSDASTGRLDLIEPDAVIDNSYDLESCKSAVYKFLREWQ